VNSAHDAALDKRPEPVDGVRVDRAVNVFARIVIDDAMCIVVTKPQVAFVLIGGNQWNSSLLVN